MESPLITDGIQSVSELGFIERLGFGVGLCLSVGIGVLFTVSEHADFEPMPQTSTFAKCHCPNILGRMTLTPTLILVGSQIWLVVQSGCIGFAGLLAKRGRAGANVELKACGGLMLFAIKCQVDVSRFVWITFLLYHLYHYAAISVNTWQDDVDSVTYIHMLYFQFINSGFPTFMIFATLGSYAAESLVNSETKKDVYEMTLQTAATRMTQADPDGSGYISWERFGDLPGTLPPLDEYSFNYICEQLAGDDNSGKGLDLEGVRALGVMFMPFYDYEKARELSVGNSQAATVLDPGLYLKVGLKGKQPDGSTPITVQNILVGDTPHNGKRAWYGTNWGNPQWLRSIDDEWVWSTGYQDQALPLGPSNENPWDACPTDRFLSEHKPERAHLADLDAAPGLPLLKLQVQARISLKERARKGTVVGGLGLLLLSPVALTHLLLAALRYAWVFFPLIGFASFLVSAAAGAAEDYADIEVPAFGICVQSGGAFKGYRPLYKKCQVLQKAHDKAARRLRQLPAIVRWMVITIGLACLSLAVQMSFNYALFYYRGNSYMTVPWEEFWDRSYACASCIKFSDARHSLNTLSVVL